MEIIMSYIDSMFTGVPVNEQTKKLREDITANMCDKYEELIKEGKSTNEAIGSVISGFGNIDEVLGELGVSRTEPTAVPAADPAVPHNKRIAVFGVLSGFGSALVVGGLSLMTSFLAMPYTEYTISQLGLFCLLSGMVFIIAAVLVRTRIYTMAAELPQNVLASMRARYIKAERRSFFFSLFGYIAELIGFVTAAAVDLTGAFGLNGILFMLFIVSTVFGLTMLMTTEKRTMQSFLGEPREKITAVKAIAFITVPFLTGAVVFTGFVIHSNGWGSPASTLACLLIVVYMTINVIAKLFDLLKKKNEQINSALNKASAAEIGSVQ